MTKITFTVLLAAFATAAQAVKLTNSDWNVVAGQTFTIGWTDAQGGVSLRLKSGPANNLQTVQEIASGQSGKSFPWTVPTNLATAQYAIEIADASGNINYSVQFPISGDGTSQTTRSSEKPATTTAALTTPSTRAEVSPTSTPTTKTEVATTPSKASETVPKTNAISSTADPTRHETRTASTLSTTRANRPSATKSDAADSGVPNSGTAGHSGSALMGAVLGVLLLTY